MKILITAASKHGSTEEIARAIQHRLVESNLRTERLPPDEVDDISAYDGVIIGSAVYGGKWMKQAASFVSRFSNELQHKPVWLFSSGPVGHPLKPDEDKAVAIDILMIESGAKEHKLFAGKINPKKLNFAEKAVTYALGVKPGDYRSWKEIEAWSAHIAEECKITHMVAS